MSRIMSCDLHWASFPASLSALLRRRVCKWLPLRKLSTHWQQNKRLNSTAAAADVACVSSHEMMNCNIETVALISLIVCVVAIWIWLWCIIISLSPCFKYHVKSQAELLCDVFQHFPATQRERNEWSRRSRLRSRDRNVSAHNLNNSNYLFCLASSAAWHSHIEVCSTRHIKERLWEKYVPSDTTTTSNLLTWIKAISILTSISNYAWHNWVSPRDIVDTMVYFIFCLESSACNRFGRTLKFDNC